MKVLHSILQHLLSRDDSFEAALKQLAEQEKTNEVEAEEDAGFRQEVVKLTTYFVKSLTSCLKNLLRVSTALKKG